MSEPFQRLTAQAARSLVEAHNLGLDQIGEYLEPLYEEIRDQAMQGAQEYSASLALVCPREHLAAVLSLLREDGYLVDVDAGRLIIRWGRVV